MPVNNKTNSPVILNENQVNQPTSVIGLDLSLRCAAAIELPLDFSRGIVWSAVRHTTVGDSLPKQATEAERCKRLADTRDHILAFARASATRAIWIEELAFSQSGSMARENAGLAWVVKVALVEAGFRIKTVPASAARKVFLGHARKGAKKDVQQALRDIGAPFADSDDVCDAFVIANFAASELGANCLMLGL